MPQTLGGGDREILGSRAARAGNRARPRSATPQRSEIGELSDRRLSSHRCHRLLVRGHQEQAVPASRVVVFVNSDPALSVCSCGIPAVCRDKAPSQCAQSAHPRNADIEAAQRILANARRGQSGSIRTPQSSGTSQKPCARISAPSTTDACGSTFSGVVTCTSESRDGSPVSSQPRPQPDSLFEDISAAPGEGFEPSLTRSKVRCPARLDDPGSAPATLYRGARRWADR